MSINEWEGDIRVRDERTLFISLTKNLQQVIFFYKFSDVVPYGGLKVTT